MTGIIAMVGTLYKKGEFYPRLQEYGMVIVDECHHAASDTMVGILREEKAKYACHANERGRLGKDHLK